MLLFLFFHKNKCNIWTVFLQFCWVKIRYHHKILISHCFWYRQYQLSYKICIFVGWVTIISTKTDQLMNVWPTELSHRLLMMGSQAWSLYELNASVQFASRSDCMCSFWEGCSIPLRLGKASWVSKVNNYALIESKHNLILFVLK